MARVVEVIGSVKNLEGAIAAPEPHHQDLKLVKHGDDEAFVIVSIPESTAEAADCQGRKPDGSVDFRAVPAPAYGKYYAASFNLHSGATEPGTLWLVWSKVNGAWKVCPMRCSLPRAVAR